MTVKANTIFICVRFLIPSVRVTGFSCAYFAIMAVIECTEASEIEVIHCMYLLLNTRQIKEQLNCPISLLFLKGLS